MTSRLTSPTDILRKEHDKVLKILNALEKNLEGWKIKQLEEKITLLEKEFDKHSLNREEKVFFPKLEIFIPREGGSTGLMIAGHKDLVKSIENSKMS